MRAAVTAGMSEEDVDRVVDYLAANPTAGDEIVGSGGCRKLRFSGRGKGKSGGYRVITFYSGHDIPVYLLTVFAKGEKANLSMAECNALYATTKAISDFHRLRRQAVGKGAKR